MQESASDRRSRAVQWLRIGTPILISAVLVVWILSSIEDPELVWEKMGRATIWPLLAIVPVNLASHLLRAWRWRRFIGEPVSVFYGFTSVMIGYAVNDILPRVGEVARVVNMNRTTQVPIARLLSTLVAERLLDVIALVALLGISFLFEGERIAEQFPGLARAGPIALLAAAVGLAVLFIVAYLSDPLCRASGRVAGRMHPGLGGKLEELIRQGADGLAFLRRPSQILPALVETTGIWVLYWVCFLLGLEAFGVLEEVGYQAGTVTFSITTFGVLVPTVGAIGSYHEFGLQSLNRLYDLDPATALACITITHAVSFYFVGGVCGVLAWGLQVLWRRRNGCDAHGSRQPEVPRELS